MGGSLSKHNWRSDRSKSKSSASTLQIKTDSDKEEQKIQKEKKVKKMPKYVSSSSCSIKSCCPNGSQPKKLQDASLPCCFSGFVAISHTRSKKRKFSVKINQDMPLKPNGYTTEYPTQSSPHRGTGKRWLET